VITLSGTSNVISVINIMLYPTNILHSYISSFLSSYAVASMAVFSISLMSCFLNYFEMVLVAPVSTGIYILHVLYFCCKVFVFYNFLLLLLYFVIYTCCSFFGGW
jgi:hypothetical protein